MHAQGRRLPSRDGQPVRQRLFAIATVVQPVGASVAAVQFAAAAASFVDAAVVVDPGHGSVQLPVQPDQARADHLPPHAAAAESSSKWRQQQQHDVVRWSTGQGRAAATTTAAAVHALLQRRQRHVTSHDPGQSARSRDHLGHQSAALRVGEHAARQRQVPAEQQP